MRQPRAPRNSSPRQMRRTSLNAGSDALRTATVFVFDVEGTLVDAVMPTLRCWRETLDELGYSFRLVDLHRYSGMDGGEMLDRLLPQRPSAARKHDILERQGKRYRAEYLSAVQPLPGVRALFEFLKTDGCRIALGTDCQKDELDHYLERTNIRDLVDAIACGSDVKRGKPHPDLFELASRRLRVRDRASILCVGDTPYDALAARKAGMAAVGVLTGHFAAPDLTAQGCLATFRDPRELHHALAHRRESQPELAEAS